LNCSQFPPDCRNTEKKLTSHEEYKMVVQRFSLLILLASLFALFTVQLPRVRGESSNDGLFKVPAKGKSDTTCNCANFNDVICRNCYDKVIKCNQVCGEQCCQYSTFHVSPTLLATNWVRHIFSLVGLRHIPFTHDLSNFLSNFFAVI
jgi:hypothetical protein